MKIENPLAFRYILQDDIYLLNTDKAQFAHIDIQEPFVEPAAATFNYLGGNKKNFLIIVHYNNAMFMPDQHLNALENTLKRLNFLLYEVAIINIANNNNAAIEDLKAFFKPQKLLILGESALLAGNAGLLLNNVSKGDNCKTLYTYSFDQMMDNTENKKAFWEQMKQF